MNTNLTKLIENHCCPICEVVHLDYLGHPLNLLNIDGKLRTIGCNRREKLGKRCKKCDKIALFDWDNTLLCLLHINIGENHVNIGENHINIGENHVNIGENHVNIGENHVNEPMFHLCSAKIKENNAKIEENINIYDKFRKYWGK